MVYSKHIIIWKLTLLLYKYIDNIQVGEIRYIWYKYNFSDKRFNLPHPKNRWKELVNFDKCLKNGKLLPVIKTEGGGLVGLK